MAYIPPDQVVSPKDRWTLVKVLHDPGQEGEAFALGLWEGMATIACRWNGDDKSVGTPQSRGLPIWYICGDQSGRYERELIPYLERIAPHNAPLIKAFFAKKAAA